MKNRHVFVIITALLCLALISGSCSSLKNPDKDRIIIGASRSLTGPLSVFEQISFGPVYKMWVEEVNRDGGIYVEEYGKKLPVEMLVYDDESDLNKMIANLEKLINEDKVDLLFPPAGTDMLLNAAPVINSYEYLMISAEGGSAFLSEKTRDLPYFFSVLNYSTHNQVPAFVHILDTLGVKTASVLALTDLHGQEYLSALEPLLAEKGIEISFKKNLPLDISDFTPIITELQAADADTFMIFAYPDQVIPCVAQSIFLNFNPDVYLVGPGGNYQFFSEIFPVEGIMSWGAWNRKCSPELKEFADKLSAGIGEENMDWWGHNVFYASLQFLKQAIEEAGTLDQKKLKAVVENSKFDTIIGPTWFDGNHLLAVEAYNGQVGQWQNGIFEVIGPDSKATADVLYPKPAWPSAEY